MSFIHSLLLVTAVAVFLIIPGRAAPVDTCITTCENRPNGDYQSCHGCEMYATCSNSILYDLRPCPANLVWDDNMKRCEWESKTCSGGGGCGDCVTSCTDRADGDYQSCQGCHVYATCSNGNIYDRRDCPAGLVWDDNQKRCEWTSTTCGEGCKRRTLDSSLSLKGRAAPVDTCITTCENRPNGDYQSCHGCEVYTTCSNGILYDLRPCPANLVWDDNLKRCEWESKTCGGGCGHCVTSCADRADGVYQSCQGCSSFVACSGDTLYETACPQGLLWDDDGKWCAAQSSTCPSLGCITSCEGRPDGDYQSCHSCHVYATCSNGNLYDRRDCPAGLVWDDNQKRCEWTSTTCGEGCKRGTPDLSLSLKGRTVVLQSGTNK